MKLKKRIIKRDYETITVPKYYGVAYREFHKEIVVFMPIPLNIIVGFGRELIWKLRKGLLKELNIADNSLKY